MGDQNDHPVSYLYGGLERAKEPYRKYSGTGEAIFNQDGEWSGKERVLTDEIVGVYVSGTGEMEESNALMIIYSKDGSVMYPRKVREDGWRE